MAGEVIMIKQNLHTHSLYCDGKDSFEEMIQTAIEKEFTILGFSSHGYTPDETLGIDEETIIKYQKELKGLKNKYKDQISIYTGIEQDMKMEWIVQKKSQKRLFRVNFQMIFYCMRKIIMKISFKWLIGMKWI